MFRIQFKTSTIVRILHVLSSCVNVHTRQRVFHNATQKYIHNSSYKVKAIRRLNGTATHHTGPKHTRIRAHHHRFNSLTEASDWGVYGILDFNKHLFGIHDVESMFESVEKHCSACKFLHCRLSLEPCHIHIHAPHPQFENYPYFLVEGARAYQQFVLRPLFKHKQLLPNEKHTCYKAFVLFLHTHSSRNDVRVLCEKLLNQFCTPTAIAAVPRRSHHAPTPKQIQLASAFAQTSQTLLTTHTFTKLLLTILNYVSTGKSMEHGEVPMSATPIEAHLETGAAQDKDEEVYIEWDAPSVKHILQQFVSALLTVVHSKPDKPVDVLCRMLLRTCNSPIPLVHTTHTINRAFQLMLSQLNPKEPHKRSIYIWKYVDEEWCRNHIHLSKKACK